MSTATAKVEVDRNLLIELMDALLVCHDELTSGWMEPRSVAFAAKQARAAIDAAKRAGCLNHLPKPF